MNNELQNFVSDSEIPQYGLDLLANTNGPQSTFAKYLGDLVSALTQPITDCKKLDTLETIVVYNIKKNAETKNAAINAIRDIMINKNLCPEAQLRCINILERLAMN